MSFWFCNLESNDSKEITFPEATPEKIISKPGLQRKIINEKSPKRKNSKSHYNKLYQYRKKKEKNSSFEKEKEEIGDLISLKDPFICLFCNGKNCKWENYLTHPNPSIKGLYSDYYQKYHFYASQRPSTTLIKKFNLTKIFKEKNIGLIINCQIPGEHPYCGPNEGLEIDSGFSYSPSIFISEGIKYINKGWADLTSPFSYQFMLDIVKDMMYTIDIEKKDVFVHCHAGNGRTGLVNACFLVFKYGFKYDYAIEIIREKRYKGLEKEIQVDFCRKFAFFVKELKMFFTFKKISVNRFVKNQMDLNFNKKKKYLSLIMSAYLNEGNNGESDKIENLNYESFYAYKNMVDFNYVPKIIYECLERIISIKNNSKNKNISKIQLYKIFSGSVDIDSEKYDEIDSIIDCINKNDFTKLRLCDSIEVISELFFIWLNECVICVISPIKIKEIFNFNIENIYDVSKYDNIHTLGNVIENYNNVNCSLIDSCLKEVKLIFSKIEYETLKYFSKFLYLIYPTEDESKNEELVKEYKKMLYKFVLFLMGYNLDEFNKMEETDKRLNQTNRLEQCISILEFFMFYNKNNNKEETKGKNDDFNIDLIKNDLKGKNEKELYYELYLKLRDKFDKNKNEDKFFEKKKISFMKKNSVIDKDKDEDMLRRKSTTGKISPKFIMN